jgi:diphthine synthase
MVLYLIGLGLGDEKDITVKGLEIVRRCSHVFLEHYTAILGSVSVERLESFYGQRITIADREMVESQAEQIMKHAKEQDVAFLVVGDPFA